MSEATKEAMVSDARAKGAAPRSDAAASQQNKLLVVDMGKASRRRLKQLKRGRGKLMGEVQSTIEEIRQSLAASLDAELLPVVVTYRRKRRKAF